MSTDAAPPSPRPRARSFGLEFGTMPTGPNNALTDVPGVRVGHVTLWHGQPDSGTPVARTGVTAIVPGDLASMFSHPMAAGTAVLNGAGELTGSVELREWGTLETPIVLTSTSAVGRAYDGVVDAMFAAGADEVVIPVVGECDDSWLDDMRRRWVTVDHVRRALTDATVGPVAEGAIGAGAGMVTMGHKAGIGTSSRTIDIGLEGMGTVGVLLLCNFGALDDLRIGGVHVGQMLRRPRAGDAADKGVVGVVAPTLDTGRSSSCLGVVVTDIPLDARQLERVARRVGLGLARMGAVAHHGSGDIFCAVSTTNRQPRHATGLQTTTVLGDASLNEVFAAVVDASEEAVTNALFVADTVIGVDGHTAPGLPVDRVVDLLRR